MKENNIIKKILYIRSAPYCVSFDNYNLQEVGLGKAFCKLGYDFDIIYYSKKNEEKIIEIAGHKLTILWRKGIKILRTGLYPSVWKKNFLNKYDIIFVSEYNQLMSVILSARHDKVYLYNGPYYNLFKIPFIEKIYDHLFCNYLNSHIKKIFAKTDMAKKYISDKGLTNCISTGVGLDSDKFDLETNIELETKEILKKMKNHRNILYVGSIIKRKNVEFLIRVFNELKANEIYSDVQLIIVGKGGTNYTNYCKSLIDKNINKDVIWCEFISNAQMKFLYSTANIFLLPSRQEIFGMVLLEAMYFKLPVISSGSAGAKTLITDSNNGFIIDNFEENIWKIKIEQLLNNDYLAKEIGTEAERTIKNNFMWDIIAKKMQEFL